MERTWALAQFADNPAIDKVAEPLKKPFVARMKPQVRWDSRRRTPSTAYGLATPTSSSIYGHAQRGVDDRARAGRGSER
jgi:hypothetical protein